MDRYSIFSCIRFHPYLWKDRHSKSKRQKATKKTSSNTSENVNESTERKCSICLDTQSYSDIHCLPCKHSFHAACINRWLERRTKCPVCKQPAVQTDEAKDKEGELDEDGTHLQEEIANLDQQLAQLEEQISINREDRMYLDKQIRIAEQRADYGAVLENRDEDSLYDSSEEMEESNDDDSYAVDEDSNVEESDAEETDYSHEEMEDDDFDDYEDELPVERRERLDLYNDRVKHCREQSELCNIKDILLSDKRQLIRTALELDDNESRGDEDSDCVVEGEVDKEKLSR